MGRAPCCDKAKEKRGPWSPEEDMTLKNYIHKHGSGSNWTIINKHHFHFFQDSWMFQHHHHHHLNLMMFFSSFSDNYTNLMKMSGGNHEEIKDEFVMDMGFNESPYYVLGIIDNVAVELLRLLETVYQHERTPDLVRILGLAKKIPKFIRLLIKNNHRLKVIRYIYAFDKVDKFPPIQLPKDHANKLCYEGDVLHIVRPQRKK